MSVSKQELNMSLCLAVREYESHRSTSTAEALMKELDELLDVNAILSKTEVEQKQFVSSIFRILSAEDSHSSLAWKILDVLLEICSAVGNEKILKHLQSLTPLVSKLVLAAVKHDRRVHALTVMQTLTYGIKITYARAYVTPLISSLVDHSKPGNENSIIQLSLSVLANLLHRNKVVLLSLMQTVNVKNFMNDLLSVRSNIMCKMEVCKLMFLLEDLIHEKPNEVEVLNFLRVTFLTVVSSVSSKNLSNLQHAILFFSDMVKEKKIDVTTLEDPWFIDSIQKIIKILDSDLDKSDLGCAILLFKFLRVFILMDIPSFSTFYQAIMEQGVAWTAEHKSKTSEVVITMQCILASQIKSQSNQGDGMTAHELISVFVSLLQDSPSTSGNHHFLTALLDLLSTALEVDLYNIVLKEYLKIEIIESLFASIPSNINIYTDFDASEPVVKMHIYLMHFVCKMATSCNRSWLNFYSCLFHDQNVISTLAAALLYGSSELKRKVLFLVTNVGFPGERLEILAKSMAECGRTPPSSPGEDSNNLELMNVKVASTYAEVDKLISNIKNLISSKKLQHISASQVLQLYQYKENVNMDYQKSLVCSLTHAAEERSLLQEELYLANQITSELRQELHCLHPTLEEMRAKSDAMEKAMEENEKTLKKALKESKSQIQNLREDNERQQKELTKATSQILNLKEQLVEKADSLKSALEEGDALKEDHGKLSLKVTNFTKELEVMELELKSKSKQISELEQDKKAKEREIHELQRIRDTVFELTGGRKKF